MSYKITVERLGKDNKIYYMEDDSLTKKLIDRETALALEWELIKAKFEESLDYMVTPKEELTINFEQYMKRMRELGVSNMDLRPPQFEK